MVHVTYRIAVPDVSNVLKERGLSRGGQLQKFFMNEVIRLSDPYAPYDAGPLKNTIVRSQDGTWYEHVVPYARVHWYGKVMVGPGLPRKASEVDMKYQGAPKRGPFWVKRMWAIEKDAIISAIEKKLSEG